MMNFRVLMIMPVWLAAAFCIGCGSGSTSQGGIEKSELEEYASKLPPDYEPAPIRSSADDPITK
ncbi:secreted protein [Rhodopirellula sp. SWK7]|nr:secreted protein [Rhodopirellula sp. SWK7]